MEIQFLINEQSVNAMTWEEYEAFERAQEGDTRLYRLRPILARFMIDEQNKQVDHEKAMKILGKVPMAKIKETINIFVETMRGSAVPKGIGTGYQSPSEPEQADTPSPAG